MKKQLLTVLMTITALSVFAISNPVFAQAGGEWGNGPGEFIDENGDGFNDLAPDTDGDGIPNKFDEDFVRPQDGSGARFGGKKGSDVGPADGTGQRKGARANKGRGDWGINPGTGTGECTNPDVIQGQAQRRGRTSG